MAVDFNINANHCISYPSKVKATRNGHTYNIQLTSDTDNGTIIGRGAYVSFDRYQQAAAPEAFKGIIREQAANGIGWYVEVTAVNPQIEALLVYETPIFTREDRDLRQDKMWYNEQGDVVEAIVLAIGDIFEVSEEGFDGKPVANKEVTVVNKKLKVAS